MNGNVDKSESILDCLKYVIIIKGKERFEYLGVRCKDVWDFMK